jgi:hypothetical protein
MIHEQSIKEKVLEQIKKEHVSMTPRMYFTFKIVALAVIVILIFFVTAFLISYIFFSIRASGQMSLLGFGRPGILTFILLFPWPILALDLGLLLMLEWLVTKFRFAYRLPFVYVTGGIVVVSVACALIIDSAHVHPYLEKQVVDRPLPGGLYKQVRQTPHHRGVFQGTVTVVGDRMFIIFYEDKDGAHDDGQRIVFLPENFPEGALPEIGDRVFVAGRVLGDDIQAFGFKKIENTE